MERVLRFQPADALFREEGTLLLYETTVVRLSALGEEIFHATAQPIHLAELAEHLAALFGAPEGDTLGATELAVHQLSLQGVVRLVE